jgi:hypothetical protein
MRLVFEHMKNNIYIAALVLFVALALPVRMPAPPAFGVSGVSISVSSRGGPASFRFSDGNGSSGRGGGSGGSGAQASTTNPFAFTSAGFGGGTGATRPETTARRIGVSSNNGQTTFAALQGAITLNYDDGRPSLTINVGTGTVLDANGDPVRDASGNAVRSLADLLKSDTTGALKASIMNVVKAVAESASTGGSTTERKTATNELASLMKVVAQADPAGASEYVSAAVGALTQSGDRNTTAIAAVIEGAKQGGATASVVTSAAITAAQSNRVRVTQRDLTSATTQRLLGTVLATTPVAIDVSVISKAN